MSALRKLKYLKQNGNFDCTNDTQKNHNRTSGCKRNKENIKTNFSSRKPKSNTKKQRLKQASAQVELSKYSQLSHLKQDFEVTMDSKLSEDSEFGFEKYQNTFYYK